ncbi:MAG: hypothetical protein J1D87_01415 [Lachnospiraceae bacterium]|nr:hypothetical protein [Lachnospiraceae bacterium]
MQIIKTIQNQTEQTNGTKKQVPVDKKMRLIQSIRAENMDNRMKIRQRENFLYGTGSMNNMPPLWSKGEPMQMGEAYLNGENPKEIAPVTNTFRIRMAAAIMLFVGFLLCDAGGYKIWGYSMNDIYGLITEDYFQIYNDKNADELPQLTELLGFDE